MSTVTITNKSPNIASINVTAPVGTATILAEAQLVYIAEQNASNSAMAASTSESNASDSASTATTQAGIATAQAGVATTQAGTATTQATIAISNNNSAQLRAWEAEAHKMTADSFANEAEDVEVKVYTSNGDGTFSSTTQTGEYSALHYKNKADADATLVNDGIYNRTNITYGVGIPGASINPINGTNAIYVDTNTNSSYICKDATTDANVWIINGDGQFADIGTIIGKAVPYTAQNIGANEQVVASAGTNAFAIDSITIPDGASLTIPDGSTFKVI